MRRPSKVPLVLAALGLLLAFPSVAAEDRLVETQRVVVVEVPVQVTVKGEPVRGLSADNFEILDNGKSQQITGFSVLDLTVSGPDDEEQPLLPQVSIAARRHFLLLFDMNVQNAGSLGRARDAVEEWLVDALHPWDLVAVASYVPRRGATLHLNFTSDRDQVRSAVAALGRSRHNDIAFADPLGLEIGIADQPFVEQTELDTADAALGTERSQSANDDNVQAAMELVYHSVHEPLQRHGERHLIREFTQSFSRLARLMSSVRGRKYVVYLSEGLDSSLIFASDDTADVQRMNQALERGEVWRVDSTRRFGSAPAQRELIDMVDEFRRADCVIQAIEIGGDRQPGANRGLSSRGTDGLFFMANETGGELYRSFNDVGESIGRILKQTSVTYLLAFQPRGIEFNDKFHKLKVKLKNGPKGARVTHRPGYYAPSEQRERSPQQRWLDAAASIMEGRDAGELSASVLATPFPAAEGPSYVPVLVEVDGASLPIAPRGSLTLEIFAYAVARDGGIAGFISQRLKLDLERLYGMLRQGGLKFFGDLELPPGDYSLRVLVRDTATGLSATRVAPLRVPDFGGSSASLLPPLFPEPRGKWLLAREASAQDTGDRPFPFMLKGDPYLPAARPVLESHAEARLCLVGYRLGGGPLKLRAEAVDSLGKVHSIEGIRLLERITDGEAGDHLVAGLSPRGLDAGEYTLTVTVLDESTGAAHANSIPFVVVHRERVTERPVGGS